MPAAMQRIVERVQVGFTFRVAVGEPQQVGRRSSHSQSSAMCPHLVPATLAGVEGEGDPMEHRGTNWWGAKRSPCKSTTPRWPPAIRARRVADQPDPENGALDEL